MTRSASSVSTSISSRSTDTRRVDAEALVALIPRTQLISAPEDQVKNEPPKVRDPFSARTWTPPPTSSAPQPPQAPVAPPIPYTFLGKMLAGGTWEVYLSRHDQTFVVHEGDILEGSYRVESVRPPHVTFTYIPLGQLQVLAIGEDR